MGREIVAIDFDGTLTQSAGSWDSPGQCGAAITAPPNLKVIEYAKQEYDLGNLVVVYTSRPWGDLNKIRAWLELHQVTYDTIECGKLRFDRLVDDKSLHPGVFDVAGD